MSKKKKKSPLNGAEARAAGSASKPADLANLALEEATTVQQAPDWPNQPAVQVAANAQQADATNLKSTRSKLVQARALVATLEATEAQEVVAVKRDRKTLQAVISLASKGDPKAITAWGSLVASRSVVAETKDAPLQVSVTSPLAGEVEARCKAVRGAASYQFQVGTDPVNPQGWPAPVAWSGSKYTFTGLTSGQKAYVRVAVVRPKTGLSQWSDAVQVTVR